MAHLQLAPELDLASAPRPGALPITLVLADDHLSARRSLRLLLDGESDLRVIAEAGDLTTVVEHVNGHRPHVLVIDLQLPNGSTVGMIRRLRMQLPETEIVVVTMDVSPAFAEQAIEAGAAGFVLKAHSDDELPEAVRTVARGEGYVSPRVAAGRDALRRRLGLRTRAGPGVSR